MIRSSGKAGASGFGTGAIGIDPVTGLPLTAIGPSPVMRADNPFAMADAAATPPPATPVSPPPLLPGGSSPAAGGGPPIGTGFFDRLSRAVMGPPTDKLSEEEQSLKARKQKKASAMAGDAAENPGEQHMGIPVTDGGDGGPLDIIKKVMSLFAGQPGG